MDNRTSKVVSGRKVNPNVSIDCVIFGFEDNDLKVLLIEREQPKTAKDAVNLALPGNLIFEDEGLDAAAERVLKELTNLDEIFLEQFKTFGDPLRLTKQDDKEWLNSIRAIPEARVITVAYYSLVKISQYNPSASGFAKRTSWCSVSEVPQLAFDHNEIFQEALKQLKSRIYRRPLVFKLLPKYFSLAELQSVYEVILQSSLDKRNFRRKALSSGFISETKFKQTGVPHKPAKLYAFDSKGFESANEAFVSF